MNEQQPFRGDVVPPLNQAQLLNAAKVKKEKGNPGDKGKYRKAKIKERQGKALDKQRYDQAQKPVQIPPPTHFKPAQRKQKDPYTMKTLNATLPLLHQMTQQQKLTPQTIHLIIKKPNASCDQNQKIIKHWFQVVNNYCSRPATLKKIKDWTFNKVIGTYARKQKITYKQALCQIALDDFWPQAKQKLGQAWGFMKNFYRQNSQIINPIISTFLQTAFPQARMILQGVNKVFGGTTHTQGPNCAHKMYIRSVFQQGNYAPAPRKQTHRMYNMSGVIQVPVVIGPGGVSTIVISPINCFYSTGGLNQKYLPFVYQSPNSTQTPFNLFSTVNSVAGPFLGQYNNTINFAIDLLKVTFINTQSALNVKGKYTVSVFYQSPNKSWTKSQITGLYNTNAITISDQQLISNQGFFRRYSCKQSQTITRLCSLIQQQNRDQALSVDIKDKIADQFYTTCQPFILIKFTGCNASTGIGSLYIDTSVSIQPVASMRKILKCTPRGSYQGTYRIFKQARKLNLPLQFMTPKQAAFMYVDDYQQCDFSHLMQRQDQYGQGKFIALPGLQRLHYPQGQNGYCIHDALQAIGIQNNLHKWASLQQLLSITDQVFRNTDKQFIVYSMNLQKNFIYLDDKQRHATAVTFQDIKSFRSYIVKTGNMIVLKTQGFQDFTQQFFQKYLGKDLQFYGSKLHSFISNSGFSPQLVVPYVYYLQKISGFNKQLILTQAGYSILQFQKLQNKRQQAQKVRFDIFKNKGKRIRSVRQQDQKFEKRQQQQQQMVQQNSKQQQRYIQQKEMPIQQQMAKMRLDQNLGFNSNSVTAYKQDINNNKSQVKQDQVDQPISFIVSPLYDEGLLQCYQDPQIHYYQQQQKQSHQNNKISTNCSNSLNNSYSMVNNYKSVKYNLQQPQKSKKYFLKQKSNSKKSQNKIRDPLQYNNNINNDKIIKASLLKSGVQPNPGPKTTAQKKMIDIFKKFQQTQSPQDLQRYSQNYKQHLKDAFYQQKQNIMISDLKSSAHWFSVMKRKIQQANSYCYIKHPPSTTRSLQMASTVSTFIHDQNLYTSQMYKQILARQGVQRQPGPDYRQLGQIIRSLVKRRLNQYYLPHYIPALYRQIRKMKLVVKNDFHQIADLKYGIIRGTHYSSLSDASLRNHYSQAYMFFLRDLRQLHQKQNHRFRRDKNKTGLILIQLQHQLNKKVSFNVKQNVDQVLPVQTNIVHQIQQHQIKVQKIQQQPMSRSLINMLLQIGGVQTHPGPTISEIESQQDKPPDK